MDLTDGCERRKQLRIALRRDLIVTPQCYEGRRHYAVKDPVRLRYFCFNEPEHFLLSLLNGSHTLDELQQQFEQRYRPQRLTQDEIERFVQQLVEAGLAHGPARQASRDLLQRRRRADYRRWVATLLNFLAIQVPLFDPDRLLSRMLPWLRWLFTPASFALGMTCVAGAVLLVLMNLDAFRARLPAAQQFFRFEMLVQLWLALGGVKIVHEFGHGLCCKAFGGEVHEMGAMFLCLSPCLYCNVSDAWTLPSKWQRMAVGFAGIYVELLLAALATFIWWTSTASSFLHSLSLSLMVVCGINTLIFNGNPLMRFDGYYVLSDWLEIPNLRERCNRFLGELILRQALGMEVRRLPVHSPSRRLFFAAYAVASHLYRWMMTFAVLWLLTMFLRPYGLGIIGALLATVAAASMVGVPLFRLARWLWRRSGRLPDMKPRRVLVTGAGLGAALAGFFFVPLPLGTVRQQALLQVAPEAVEPVYLPVSGILERLHVQEGQRVQQGDLLAEFRSRELEDRRAEAQAEYDIRCVQVQALRAYAASRIDPEERARVEASLAKAASEQARSAREATRIEQLMERLQLRAPRAGVVMGLPPRDEIGKTWEKDPASPFCRIADPDRLWALVPLVPADYRLVREDWDAVSRKGSELKVSLGVPGRGCRTYAGRIVQLPESEATELPLALTQPAGGPVVVRASEAPGGAVPLGQHYLVGVELLSADAGVCPGGLVRVRIHCHWRTAAWWLWRALAATFDLGLV